MEGHSIGEIAEKVSRWQGMELGEVVQDVFAVWEAEKNGACGAIQTLLALPKPGGDNLSMANYKIDLARGSNNVKWPYL